MPTISMFYGIIIRMYCAPGEHNPPHVHAYYQEHKAVFNIRDCELTNGKLPVRQSRSGVGMDRDSKGRTSG